MRSNLCPERGSLGDPECVLIEEITNRGPNTLLLIVTI